MTKPQPFYRDDIDLLSHCVKNLAHAGHVVDGRPRKPTEPWRYPLISSAVSPVETPGTDLNNVTFIYVRDNSTESDDVAVVGTFAELYQPIPLRPVRFLDKATRYASVSMSIPKREFHTYRFLVSGLPRNDPINPQTRVLDNGAEWSCFFTDGYAMPSVLTQTELCLLSRLVARITPLRTPDAENFLKRFYNKLDQEQQSRQQPHAYRLDDLVGEVNFIDNLLARGERHRLSLYRLALRRIDDFLKARHPDQAHSDLPEAVYEQVLELLQTNMMPGWEVDGSCAFLQVLRRHAVMGAFTHPRYGGNSAASGWNYLRDRYVGDDPSGTCFDWPIAIERPLGTSDIYFG